MRNVQRIVVALAAFGTLAALAPLASANHGEPNGESRGLCAMDYAYGQASGAWIDFVLKNYRWPGDAWQHVQDWQYYHGSDLLDVLACPFRQYP